MKENSEKKPQSVGSQINSTGLTAIVEVVKSITPISETDIQILISLLENKSIKKHAYLLKEGEICRHAYFLVKGFFRMYYLDFDGNEINYRFTAEKNFLVDFQSFLTQRPSNFNWQAMEDSELFALPYQQIQEAYSASPSWNTFGRLIAERVYLQLNERVEMLQFMTPEERYTHIVNTNQDLLNRVTLFHLSSYLGIKPESLSRLRKRLTKR